MPAINLTDRTLRSLKTNKAQEDFLDKGFGSGSFGVRVYKSGAKKFFFLDRNVHGERRRMDIGDSAVISLSGARDKARKLSVQVHEGRDPSAEKTSHRKAETVKALCEEYLELHARPNKRPRSVKEDERIIERDIIPTLGRKRAVDVARRDILVLLEDIRIRRNAPVMANRTRALLHKVFAFGVTREVITHNPVDGLPRLAREQSRERVLSYDELKLLLKHLDGMADQRIASAYRLILYTGQRPGEVLGMQWKEIKGPLWTIPADRSKNGKSHQVHLTICVLAILERVAEMNKVWSSSTKRDSVEDLQEYVFPSPRAGHIRWTSKSTLRLVEEMKIPRWTPHDLRRSMATHLENLGISAEVIDQMQNHRKQGVKAVYQRGNRWMQTYQAWEKWSAILERLQKPSPNSSVSTLAPEELEQIAV